MLQRNKHFGSVPEATEFITELLREPRFARLSGAMFTAAVLADGRLASGTIVFSDQPASARPVQTGPDLTVAEEWLDAGEVADRIRDISQGGAMIAGRPVRGEFSSIGAVCVDGWRGSRSVWPEWQLTFAPRNFWQLPQAGPITLGRGGPLYISVGHAIEEFVNRGSAGSWHPGGEQPGRLVVAIPDRRVRLLARWDYARGQVLVDIDGDADVLSTLELQAVANSTPTWRASRRASRGSHTLGGVTNADWVLVAVVGDKGAIAVAELRPFWPGAGLSPDPAGEERDAAEKDLAAGEGEEVEFKPFIRDDDSAKKAELIKAVVAFANTVGGRLYLGVSDDGQPQGHGAAYGAGFNGAGPIEQARAWVHKLITESVKPTVRFSADIVSARGQKIVRVRVDPGPRRPYSTMQSDVYIRSGATSRKPDPRTEMPVAPDEARSLGWTGGP